MHSHTGEAKQSTTGSPKMRHGRPGWTGNITALPDGHPMWTWPLTWPGVENPALGPENLRLFSSSWQGDLFVTGGPRKTSTGCVRPSRSLAHRLTGHQIHSGDGRLFRRIRPAHAWDVGNRNSGSASAPKIRNGLTTMGGYAPAGRSRIGSFSFRSRHCWDR